MEQSSEAISPVTSSRLEILVQEAIASGSAQAGETADTEKSNYMQGRQRKSGVRRVVEAFELYRPYLPLDARTILDFGCGMGIDALMIRETLGSSVQIYGLDVDDNTTFKPIRERSGLIYTQIDHPYRLPYEDDRFDVVVASGVLEHVRMDNESLKELHRVLRPNGILIVTFLPNRHSYTEFLARRLNKGGHQRMYSRFSFDTQLRHLGFAPLVSRFHQFIPAANNVDAAGLHVALSERLWPLNGVLERAWPTKFIATNLMFVARAQPSLY